MLTSRYEQPVMKYTVSIHHPCSNLFITYTYYKPNAYGNLESSLFYKVYLENTSAWV